MGYAVVVIVVGSIFGALLVSILQHREADRIAARSTALLAAEDEAEQHILDLDRNERGYLVTRDPTLLTAWQQERAGLIGTDARLGRLAHTPDQARQVRAITRVSQSYLDDSAMPALEAARRGDPAARSPATLREDERRVAELRDRLDRLTGSERQFLAEHDRLVRARSGWALTASAFGMAGAVLLGCAVVGYASRAVARPVRRAGAMLRRLARGDLACRVPETGAGELRDLARSCNLMGDALQRRVRHLARTAREQAAARRIATRAAGGAPPAAVLDAAGANLERLIGSNGAHVMRYEDDGTATVVGAWRSAAPGIPVGARLPLDGRSVTATVRRTGRPARMDSLATAPGAIAAQLRRCHVRGTVAAPILVEGRVWGAVHATVAGERPLAPAAEARLADCAELIAAAVANARARSDLAASRFRLLVAADRDRRRIERDLHHGIQQLIAIGIQAGDAVSSVPEGLPELRRHLSEVPHGLNAVLDDLREVSRDIYPTMLSDRGLRPALKALARRSDVPVEIHAGLDRRLPEPIETAAYHVAAEALANTARHARASHARLEVTALGDRLRLTVRDDGAGGADPVHGNGLLGLTDRVHALGGSFSISSPPGHGTTLEADLPLELAPGPSSSPGAPAGW
ncbi:HAMP domain-containing protein [Dactylosporangium sp. CA-052675]|uniref:HAMP domain-containing protein n=1 Tax=Dactylosporangium sp. CA-052675 TaxID=3239927 RepID=UPI003D8E42A7